MGRTPSGHAKYQIETLWDRHKEINRRLALGQENKQIALELGITPTNVSNVRNSHLAREHRSGLQDMADEEASNLKVRIAKDGPVLYEMYQEMLKKENLSDNLRFKMIQDMLDRGGYGAVQKSQNISAKLTKEDLDELTQRGVEAGIIQVVAEEANG